MLIGLYIGMPADFYHEMHYKIGAIYVTDSKTLIISPQNISSRKQYLEEFSGKLYCPTAGCNAQLDYVELPYSGHEKIFRTHKGSMHNKSNLL